MSGIQQAFFMAPIASNPISFVAASNLSNQTSDASRSLTLSSHSVGDMLVAMTANRTSTPPDLLTGYTNILTESTGVISRSIRVQYKIASSTSETITWTGAYGFLLALRNAKSIGVTNTLTTGSISATQPLPDLSGLSATGLEYILAGIFVSNGYTSVTSPYTLLAGSAGNFAAGLANNSNSSITSTSVTLSSGAPPAYAIEFKP